MNYPIAKKIPEKLIKHDHCRIDNYYWLRNRDDAEVIDYLNKENEYTKEQLKDTEALQETLFEEITSRIKQDDMSVPYYKKGFFYYVRYEEGKEYAIYCRKPNHLNEKEEILLDINEIAGDYTYYDVKGLSVSPDNKFISYGVDKVGRRKYAIYIKNLETNKIKPTGIKNTTGPVTWASDGKTIFYTRKDPVTLRSCMIFRNDLVLKNEELIYEEKDETFNAGVYKSRSEKYIIINSGSSLSDEYRILDASDPKGEFRLFHPREENHEYSIHHIDDRFYIRSNKNAHNFKIFYTHELNTSIEHWKEIIPHRDHVLLEGIDLFKNYMVLSERMDAQQKLRIINFENNTDHYLEMKEEAYSIYVSVNPEFDTQLLRFSYNSLTTPHSVFDYHMNTREKNLLKQQEVLNDFRQENYISKKYFIKADDGEEIPLTMVHHKNTNPGKNTALLLYGYGSYGHTIDPFFSIARLSLLDRGFIYAIAHVRGSEIKGRKWYEDGKMLNKKNTFTDFISCAQYLIQNSFTSQQHLYAMGGSAGGLLMGCVINMAPQLFKGIIATVPFVDVVTTMLDVSIPLTTGEYDEWGNPNIKEHYDYILSYSPYDNIKEMEYPTMLVTTGFHDSQVQYWEPAKWVAKLRDMKTDQNLLLFKIDMEAGHSGTTGRFKAFRETALDYAFLLKLEGIKK